jgi:hypothetical protein
MEVWEFVVAIGVPPLFLVLLIVGCALHVSYCDDKEDTKE